MTNLPKCAGTKPKLDTYVTLTISLWPTSSYFSSPHDLVPRAQSVQIFFGQ